MDDLTGVPDWGRLSWPRATERLTLRPATPDDAAAMFGYRSLEHVSKWMTQIPTDLESWQTHFEERSPYALMICRDDEVVGDLFLKTEDAWGRPRCATAHVTSSPRSGGAWPRLTPVRAGRPRRCASCWPSPSTGLVLRRVTANCFADNEPSWRLMERVGMRRESHNVGDTLHRDGEWYDGLVYALLAEEWLAR